MSKKAQSICNDCVHLYDNRCLAEGEGENFQQNAQSTGSCKRHTPLEPNFSLHADTEAWKCKVICDDCVNKDGGSCYVYGEDGELPEPAEILEAQATGKCEYYIHHTKV